MDIRNSFQDLLLVILLLNIHRGLCSQDDDYEDGPLFGRCPGIRNKLKNGRVRYRYKGRIAKFLCDSGYELAGKRSSTCVRGQWSNPLPVCVARGCSRVPSIANGRVTEMYRGALLVYDCNPGYTIAGDSSIHCDGRKWTSSPPVCGISTTDPETRCDFENPYLCGWTHDPTHDFDWKRNQFTTPSGHVGTGPSYDHTFGENKAGYYLYIEASSPRRINDTARLFSPVYPSDESGGCFMFWYHMYGATTGGIRVYLKPESHVFGELSPKWEKFGDQGNQWLQGVINVPQLHENFQIIIEGIRGESYVGDSAIDDVQLTTIDCESIENMTDTTTESTVTDSCRGRCRGSDTSLLCGCNENCLTAENCCSDYHTLCTEGNETFVQHSDEPLPGDFYGKTTSPVTVTVTSTSQLSSEVLQTSTAVPYSSLESTSATSAASFVSASVAITSSAVTVNTKTAPPSSSASTVVSTTAATTPAPTTSTLVTKPSTIHVESPKTPLYISTASSTDTSSRKKNTAVYSTTPKTTVKDTTTVTATSLKNPSTTPSTVITSTSSAPKQTTNTARATSTTAKPVTASTTTLISTISTPSPTSTSTIPTSTSTTPASTSTTVATTSTTVAKTSTTVAKTSTSVAPSSSFTTSITESTTILNTVLVPVTQFQFSSSSTTDASSSLSPSTTLPDTTTQRYNLRPRKTTAVSTSTLTYFTASNNSTAIRNSTLPSAPTFTSLRTEILSTSPAVSSTSQPKRWFTFTVASTTTVRSTAKTSTTTTPRSTIIITRYTPETSKPTFRIFKPTPVIQPSSFTTTSESYNMIASKSESSKSNSNPAVTISIAVIVVICIAAGVTYYLRRYRSKRQSKLDDDSEMRFLPDSDYMDYSDASALDKILVE